MVGRCIKEWGKIEDWVFRICHIALMAPETQAAIVYFRTPSIDARVQLTTELLNIFLPEDHPFLDQWRDLAKELRSLLPVRNLLAHAPVKEGTDFEIAYQTLGMLPAPLGSFPTPRITHVHNWIEIGLSEHEKLRDLKKDVEKVEPDELEPHYNAIADLAKELWAFYVRLSNLPPAAPFPHNP